MSSLNNDSVSSANLSVASHNNAGSCNNTSSAPASTGPSAKRLKRSAGMEPGRSQGARAAHRPAPVPSEMSRGGSVAARARERAWQPERDLAFKFQLKRMEQAEARSVRDHVAAENAKARDHELQMAQMRLEEGKQQMLISFLKAAEKGVFN